MAQLPLAEEAAAITTLIAEHPEAQAAAVVIRMVAAVAVHQVKVTTARPAMEAEAEEEAVKAPQVLEETVVQVAISTLHGLLQLRLVLADILPVEAVALAHQTAQEVLAEVEQGALLVFQALLTLEAAAERNVEVDQHPAQVALAL